MNQYRWEVEQRDGKWFCNGYRYKQVGNVEICIAEPVESHEFTTEWAAKAQKRFCQRLELDHRPIALSFSAEHSLAIGTLYTSVEHSLIFQVAGRTVLALDRHYQVKTLDLPYIVWAWLRTTAVARGLRAFWYGWGQKPSQH